VWFRRAFEDNDARRDESSHRRMPTEQKYFRKDRRDPEWEVCGEDNLRAGVPGERVAFWRRPMRYDAIMYR